MNLNKEIQNYLMNMYNISDENILLQYFKAKLSFLNDICGDITDEYAKKDYIEIQRFIIEVTSNYVVLLETIKGHDKY